MNRQDAEVAKRVGWEEKNSAISASWRFVP
jgi:hypothetical protein